MDELIEEKTEIILKLIRSNCTADEVIKITQAFVNITNGKNFRQQGKPTRKQGAGAT